MAVTDPAEPRIARVGRWLLEERLGAGAFGTVWRARDAAGHVAVVKQIDGPPGDELRALARIHHPGVVEALDAGSVPVPHLVMALAPGAPLDAAPLPQAEAIRALGGLVDALAACHEAGVAHGDVKPANVLLDRETGRVTLVDFGLASGRGGTPRYAAPERFSGAGASPAADVWAFGVVAWELLAGRLPWADGAFGAPEALPARAAPLWLRRLVDAALDPLPELRPPAAAAADAFDAAGVALPARTAADVARRARIARVARPLVDAAVSDWLRDRGAVAIVGPTGAGRTRHLRLAEEELQARGVPYVRLGPGGGPWSAVEAALVDPGLPGPSVALPRAADRIGRAEAAAEALLQRAEGRLTLIVDDWHRLDAGSRDTVLAAAERGAAALASGDTRLPAPFRTVALAPLSASEARRLFDGVLGRVDPAVADAALAAGSGWPGDLVRFAVAAVDAGALAWRRRGWVVDRDALARVVAPAGRAPAGSPAARRLAAVVALGQPIRPADALAVAGADERALDELLAADLVRGVAWLVSSAAPPEAPDPALCRALAALWLADTPVPHARLARVLACTGDAALAAEHGAACVRALAELDPAGAVGVGEALVALAPGLRLAEARVAALAAAGRAAEARQVGAAALDAAGPGEDTVPLLVTLAGVEDAASEDARAMRAWLDRAPAGARSVGLALARARAAYRARDLAAAAASCHEVLAEPPDPTRAGPWLAALGLFAQVAAAQDGPLAGLRALEALPDELGRGSPDRVLLDGIRGRLLWHAGRSREAAVALEAAAAQRRALITVDRARLENNAALCWYTAGDVQRAVAGWERALLAFERVGAPLEALRVEVNLTLGYRDLGRWTRAEQAGERAVRQAQALGLPLFEAAALGNLGDVALWQRDLARAAERYDAAERLAVGDELAGERVELARRRAELAVLRRDADAVQRATAAVDAALAAEAGAEVARSLAVRAWAQAAQGRADEVGADAERCVAMLREQGAYGELAVARCWIGEAWLAAGRGRLAAPEAQAVLGFADEFDRPPLRRWAEQILARARPETPVTRLDRLTQLAVRVALHPSLDEVLGELANAAVELVDAERALVVLVEGDDLRIAARAGRSADEGPSMSVVRRVLSTGREIVATDLEERGDLRSRESVVALHLRAALCVPLAVDGRTVGALYLDSRTQSVGDLGQTAALIRALAAHGSIAVRNARQLAEIADRVDSAREIAHDLRNPLSGILLLASDALDSGEPLGTADAQLLVDAVRHALVLVDQSLGATPAPLAPIDLGAELIEWLASPTRTARMRDIVVEVDVEAVPPVVGRVAELRRVVTNLVGNALKYCPAGGRVSVRLGVDGSRVRLEIADTGPGFAPDDLGRVFARGVQGAGALPGHGLGLAIAARIVAEHGGEITVANRPEGGAVATVRLPSA